MAVVVVEVVVMVVNVSPLVLSFALSPSLVQGRHDSVWVHLVLSGRYGNLDHPLLPSRHPPPSSPLPGPLKLSLFLSLSLVLVHPFSLALFLFQSPFLFRSLSILRALFFLFLSLPSQLVPCDFLLPSRA